MSSIDWQSVRSKSNISVAELRELAALCYDSYLANGRKHRLTKAEFVDFCVFCAQEEVGGYTGGNSFNTTMVNRGGYAGIFQIGTMVAYEANASNKTHYGKRVYWFTRLKFPAGFAPRILNGEFGSVGVEKHKSYQGVQRVDSINDLILQCCILLDGSHEWVRVLKRKDNVLLYMAHNLGIGSAQAILAKRKRSDAYAKAVSFIAAQSRSVQMMYQPWLA